MKHLFLLACFFLSLATTNAQSLPDFSKIPVDKKEDFTPETNKAALQAATYILTSTPESLERNKLPGAFLITWMTNSPDYTFELDEPLMNATDDNKKLFPVLMAAMAQYVLQNNANKDNKDLVLLNTVRSLITYANNPANKIVPGKNLKKAMSEDKKGTLAEYLARISKQPVVE